MQNKLAPICIALLLASILGCNSYSHSQAGEKNKDFRVSNIIVDKQSDHVVVYYDLHCKQPDADFNVNLYLELDEGEFYHVNGANTTGALGKNITPGTQKKIIWNISQDFPFGLEADKVNFVVQAIPKKKK